jgi:hypothetical protein
VLVGTLGQPAFIPGIAIHQRQRYVHKPTFDFEVIFTVRLYFPSSAVQKTCVLKPKVRGNNLLGLYHLVGQQWLEYGFAGSGAVGLPGGWTAIVLACFYRPFILRLNLDR